MMAVFLDAHGDFVLDDGPACRHYVNTPQSPNEKTHRQRASRREVAEILAECERLGGLDAAAEKAGIAPGQLRKLAARQWVPVRETAQGYMERLQAARA